ncbi:MAG: hypothetical protein O7A07_09120 [Acidobacteria bacterium]|nr:hypothetical protein [Acidobacteriota bacterium]
MSMGNKKGTGHQDRVAGSMGEVEVVCPCCQTKLLADAATGVVLREDRKKKPTKSFENMLEEDRARREASDELFGKALASERHQKDLLQRKFEKALEKAAAEPDKKPRNPFDLD